MSLRESLRFQLWFPFLKWRHLIDKNSTRSDLEAGAIGAVLIMPQSIALATLAGMPAEYGIYTSIFPVIIAAFWGSSLHALSGPNTAVCVMLGASVAPFANVGNEYYIGFVLAITFMVGLIQLFLGVFRLGALLDFISTTVINAIVLAVALIMIVSSLNALLGLHADLNEKFFVRIYQIFNKFGEINFYAATVGVITLISGFVARRYVRRYALVCALLVGTVVGMLVNVFVGSATSGIEMVGYLHLSSLPFSAPSFSMETLSVMSQLTSSAFAIAFLGLMQTVLIARSLSEKSGQVINTNQEILGQGISNIIAPFFSSFASSASFNRSSAHYDAGAKTPMAALYASVILAIIAISLATIITYIPIPVVAALLILVGYWLIEPAVIKKVLCTRQESIIFFVTLASALIFGLNNGVFTGLALSLFVYLWYASIPNIVVRIETSNDGKPVYIVTIDGNLFFGSVRHVEKAFARLGDPGKPCVIVLRTDHITYIDAPGAELLGKELAKRRAKGDEMYLFINRSNVISVLRSTGCLKSFGEEYVLVRGLDHPMMYLVQPSSSGKYLSIMDE